MTTEKTYVIVETCWEGGREDWEPYALYWNNDDGWGSHETATVFSAAEMARLNLPQGGQWVPND